MHFYNLLEVKVQYTPGCYYGMKLCGIIWKLWYLFNLVCMEHICPKQFVWNIICPNQIIWKFYYCCYRLCPSRFFQYRVYGSCYCEMVVMVCAGICMEHYLSKPNYMEVYLLLPQIVEWLLWYV